MNDQTGRIGEIDWKRLSSEAGWTLLPLRAFLAVVFLDGGVSKVADSRFLDDSSPVSMHAQVLAVKAHSPIGSLLTPAADHSFAFGVVMAVGELAVGIGLLLGLWTRLAAVGAMVLALSLWLTVSWGADPWFTSADLVYLFALTPLLLAGAGGVLSVDAWLARAVTMHPGRSEDRTRRALVTGAAGVAGLVVLGAASLTRRSASHGVLASDGSGRAAAPSTGSPATPSPAGSATAGQGAHTVAKTADVPVGGGKEVKDPVSGDPAWVLQLESGAFTAFSAVCPHQGCAVNFESARDGFACPCHGSRFSATGELRRGPATRGLTPIAVHAADGVVTLG